MSTKILNILNKYYAGSSAAMCGVKVVLRACLKLKWVLGKCVGYFITAYDFIRPIYQLFGCRLFWVPRVIFFMCEMMLLF